MWVQFRYLLCRKRCWAFPISEPNQPLFRLRWTCGCCSFLVLPWVLRRCVTSALGSVRRGLLERFLGFVLIDSLGKSGEGAV